MMYLKGGNFRLAILETANLDELKKGRPITSVDHELLIAWTPDPGWLAEQIRNCDGDMRTIGKLIDQAAKRPEQPLRPHFDPEVKEWPADHGGK